MTINSLSPQIELRSYLTTQCRHSHNYAQLVLPIIGTMEIEIGHQAGIINNDTAVFIAPDEQHCFAGSQENLFVVVDISQKNTTLFQEILPHFFSLTPAIKKFLQFMHYYLADNKTNPPSDYLVQNLLFNLISEPLLIESDKIVRLAKQWIDLNFRCPIQIEKLAKHCYLSSSQLQRRFKQSTGFGIAEYWRLKRLEYAKQQLSENHCSIENIAFDVGYENASAFSRAFHKSFGLSPLQWRQVTCNAKNLRLKGKANLSNSC